jgi:hypothetical protein
VDRHRNVEFLGEREVRLVQRIAERAAGVLGGDLAEHAQRAVGERPAHDAELGQRNLLGAAHAGGRDDELRGRIVPVPRSGQPIAIATADHAAHDAEPLHLGQAHPQVLLAVGDAGRPAVRRVGQR